jgi:hypothetical protein
MLTFKELIEAKKGVLVFSIKPSSYAKTAQILGELGILRKSSYDEEDNTFSIKTDNETASMIQRVFKSNKVQIKALQTP